MTTILVFITGKDSLNKRDLILMKIVFTLIVLADLALISISNPTVGILLFAFAQLGFIIRNSKGMKEKLNHIGNTPLRSSLFVNTILSSLLFLIFLIQLMKQHLDDNVLTFAIILYGLIVSISLWTALANYLLRLFPRINSTMVCLGMIFFVLCDLNVGLCLILPDSTIKIISSSLIWMFYTPALTLLALSGYRYEKSL